MSPRVGVVGVGHMGQNHVRVYSEMPGVDLVGVFDADEEQADQIATEYGTTAYSMDDLLDTVDMVSIAVPTQFHAPIAHDCIDAGVDLLVEKPFVEELDVGRELVRRAEEAGVTLQVGHIERFNPAITALDDIVTDLDIIAVEAHRLGPPINRDLTDSVVMDLMIHDVDIVLSLVDAEVESVSAVGTRNTQYADAQIQFDDGTVVSLTASRLTQRKVRTLSVTADECRVDVDYISQSVDIHRNSLPEYIKQNGELRYRHESIVEQPMVEKNEPLRDELTAFVKAATENETPRVTGTDALRAIEVTRKIDELASKAERHEVIQ